MKINQSIFIFLSFIIVGCNPVFYPADLKNSYFENVSIVDYDTNLNSFEHKLSFNDGILYELASQSRGAFSPYIIEFYQKENKQCFMYSYTKEQLKILKTNAKLSLMNFDTIFLIKQDGLSVVSVEEYNSIKPTLKPHPYDPSLCKPKPSEIK